MLLEITQRELRNNSVEIMSGLDQGESYTVTRNGTPVGVLSPIQVSRFVKSSLLRSIFSNLDPVDFEKFRNDMDSVLEP